MMSMLYKLRLIFAGILVALGAAVFAQIDGGISAPPFSGDASLLVTGELDDDRLSANVPLLDASNTFTGALNRYAGTTANRMIFRNDSAPADSKAWSVFVDATSGDLSIRARPDASEISGGSIPLFIRRGGAGTAITAIELAATSIKANGAEVATLTTGIVETSVQGCTTADSVQVDWDLVGTIVSLRIIGALCTSNASTMTLDDVLPAAIRPPGERVFLGAVTDNGATDVGMICIGTDGSVTFSDTVALTCASVFTSSGSKGYGTVSVAYSVNL
jgi:hypothetical protein